MARSVMRNNKGMTLIEVMISITLLLIVSVALMQASLLGYQQNMTNSLREEAVRIGDDTMDVLRARPYTLATTDPLLSAGTTSATVTRNLRSFQAQFVTKTTITDISPENKQVAVEVDWNFKGLSYSHTTNAILGRK